jgi:hypothetical protein
LTIDREAAAKTIDAAALSLDAVGRALDNRSPRKVVVVRRRIVCVAI